MRILLLSNYYPEHIGGIETIAATLVAGYRKRGHEVRWMAGDISRLPHAGAADDVAIPVWNGVERLGFPYPLPSPAAMRLISDEVRWCDVIHMHDCLYAINVATFMTSRRVKRNVLLTQHVADVPYPNPLLRGLQSAAYATIGRGVLSSAEQVVFYSTTVKQKFEAWIRFRKPPVLIPNGVDFSLFHPVSPGERDEYRKQLGVGPGQPLLMFVGMFKEKKGVGLLESVIGSNPKWTWVMIGRTGDINPSLWKFANLRVLPPLDRPQLRDYYGAADMVVLPGREAFPMVAQESMASGTPVFLSEESAGAAPGARDVLFSGSTRPDDLLASIQTALDAVQSDGDVRRRVAGRARELWSVETMIGSYESELEILKSPAASGSMTGAGRTG